jgi:hypothetical protein
MVRGLTVLNSAYSGSRDLWWPIDQVATIGFNVYRAYDARTNWVKLNPEPVAGQFYRDETTLEPVKYVVQPQDWIDMGQTGSYRFRLPEIPFSDVVEGRPVVANSPNDVCVEITTAAGVTTAYRPAEVSGIDQTVWLRIDNTLPVGGAVSSAPIIDFATAEVYTVIFKRLVNFVDLALNMARTFYAVIPVTDHGEEHAPDAFGTEVVNTLEVDHMDYVQAEMVRRNAWIFEQRAEPASLLIKRRYGYKCGCTENGTQIPLTRCPSCYETGIVSGYYGPFSMAFIDPDNGAVRTIDEGGIKVERQSRSYLGRTPVVQDGDLIIRKNGERLVINNTTYTMPRGVLLQQEFSVELLNSRDTRYLIPLVQLPKPIIFNPVFPDPLDGIGGAEPIFQVNEVPGRHWENQDKPVGRTVTWGNIQTSGI